MASRRDFTTLGYRRIVQLLVYLGIVPGVLLSAIGVLLLVLDKGSYNLLIGILVLSFTGTLVTGVILVWVFLRRERNLSELQADFVSKVSHELRTPLTSIRMFTETLSLRRGDKTAEDRCIEALNKESVRLQRLIDRLLDWGRWRAGGASTSSPRPTSLCSWTRPSPRSSRRASGATWSSRWPSTRGCPRCCATGVRSSTRW